MLGLMSLGALADPPPTQTPATPVQKPAPAEIPDGEFIEFLGADDVDDSTWWEFLNHPGPRKRVPPPPPTDAEQH